MSHNPVLEKIKLGHRFSKTESLALYDEDIYTLGEAADFIRQKMHDKKVYYNINRHINPTNICKDSCKFCAYSANRKSDNQYYMEKEEILKEIDGAVNQGAKEVHIVSAHNNKNDIDWYADLFKSIKKNHSDLTIKAMSAAEVDYLARISKKDYKEILEIMDKSGVDSMPGGGAEIFDEELRKEICAGKVGSSDWLKIHEIWHSMGKNSNATMLFGHIESRAHRIDHMMRLRELQDKSGGFQAFIPLVFQIENNYLDIKNKISSEESLKTFAISRIVLDNFPTIKAYWATTTMKLALIAQEFGANDIDGTIQKESIQSAAGANSANGMSLEEIVFLIKDAGFVPVERDSVYNEI